MRKEPDFPLPTPAEAIAFRMEQQPHTRKELIDLLGSKERASEYLSGKRYPSKRHALLLWKEWGVPINVLLQPKPKKKIK